MDAGFQANLMTRFDVVLEQCVKSAGYLDRCELLQ
jgi:hypothetical protein